MKLYFNLYLRLAGEIPDIKDLAWDPEGEIAGWDKLELLQSGAKFSTEGHPHALLDGTDLHDGESVGIEGASLYVIQEYWEYLRDTYQGKECDVILYDPESALIAAMAFRIVISVKLLAESAESNLISISGSRNTSNAGAEKIVILEPVAAALPAVPQWNKDELDITAASIKVHWLAAENAIGYKLDVSEDSEFKTFAEGYEDLDVGDVKEYNAEGLSSNTTYYFRLRAYSASAESGNSDSRSGLTLCAAPTGVTASSPGQTSFTASWTSNGADKYYLDVSTHSNFSDFVTGYENREVTLDHEGVTGLSYLTTYYIRVRAYNASGSSENSSTANTTTKWHSTTEAYLAAMTSSGDTTYQKWIDDFVRALDGHGLLSIADSVWLFCNKADTGDAVPASFVNLVNPGGTKASKVNSPAYTTYGGWSANGGANGINLGKVFGTSNYTLNDCAVAVWCTSEAGGLATSMGCKSARSVYTIINPRYTTNNARARMNNVSAEFAASANNTALMTGFTRVNNDLLYYKDGAYVETQTKTVVSIPASVNIYACGYNNEGTIATGNNTRVVKFFWEGKGLTATQQTNLYNDVAAWIAAHP